VIGEMLIGEPLFPGDSSLDQLVEIIKILGTPTPAQVMQMNPNSDEFKFPNIKAQAWSKVYYNGNPKKFQVFKNADPQVIDLVSKLLVYNPKARPTALEALMHPYFNELRQKNFSVKDCKIPDLFNFNQGKLISQIDCTEELSSATPEILAVLIPNWKNSK
jgi:serine/threonine protein kinase